MKVNVKKFFKQTALILSAVLFLSSAPAIAAEKFDSTSQLESNMKMLTGYRRGAGYEGEREAAKLLVKEFKSYGYSVSLQTFPATVNDRSYNSVNVIARRKADVNPGSADILIVSSHLDSKAQTVGAVDNASGTAVLLESARLISQLGLSTDKELRFIAFGAEEDGLLGSAAYVASLSKEEKSRIIGDIQLDMLGGKNSLMTTIKTVNGDETLLSRKIQETASELGITSPPLRAETMSDHTSFMRHGIPAILLEQDRGSYENHTIMDDMTMIDLSKLNDACVLVLNSIVKILGEKADVPLSKQAREITDFDTISGLQQTTEILDFGLEQRSVENKIGIAGEMVHSGKNEFGDSVESYAYSMRWFGMDEPLTTVYKFRNSYLEEVEIQAQKDGYSPDELLGLIGKDLGTPTITETPDGKTYGWDSWKYRKFYELTTAGDNYTLSVFNSTNNGPVEETYNLAGGLSPENDATDSRHKKIWRELISKIIPPEDYGLIGELVFYSDGYHGMTGYTQAAGDGSDNSQMRLAVDTVDIFDDFGRYRNFDRSVYVITHEYGHVLSLNGTQVKLGEPGDIPVFYEQCNYLPDSYMRKFYETFCAGLTDSHYSSEYINEHWDYFVSPYATNNISEDFADSFAAFVLAPKQAGTTVGEQKVNFFYQFPELVETRDFIRGNFGWE